MRRLLIIADKPNWAFAKRAKSLQDRAPDHWEVDIVYYDEQSIASYPFEKHDVVFCLPTNLVTPLRRLFDATRVSVPFVASHNSGMGRRLHVLYECLLAADFTIVNNYGAYYNARAMCQDHMFRACNVSNGVDLTQYYVETPIEDRPHKVLWCSSSEKIDPLKAEEILQGGEDVKGYYRILRPLKHILEHRPEKWEVDYLIVDAGQGLDDDDMRTWYNSGSYLVCASTSEGTPNIALEAAACGCVIVSSPVGNMPELIHTGFNGKIVSGRTTSGFWKSLKWVRPRRDILSVASQETIKLWGWDKRAPYFYRVFDLMARGKTPRPFTYMNTEIGDIGRG